MWLTFELGKASNKHVSAMEKNKPGKKTGWR